jgi:adenylate kinase
MLKRATEENRPDDTPDVIARRLATYHAETEPIVEHYRVTGRLVPLHAERTIDEVWTEIQAALEQVGASA